MKTATNSTLTIDDVDIESLHPDTANPRRISAPELEALTRSMKQWGFVQPVLARREGHVIIGGHQRLVAARRLGIKTVPVIFLDASQEQARLLNVALTTSRANGTRSCSRACWPTSSRSLTSRSPASTRASSTSC